MLILLLPKVSIIYELTKMIFEILQMILINILQIIKFMSNFIQIQDIEQRDS